jgi:transcriptional/translational regulatory protein YebC/TACO1
MESQNEEKPPPTRGGKIFGRLVKEIMIAARNGADPDLNPKLRL